MNDLAKKRSITGEQIFNEVIAKKKLTKTPTREICNALEENEEVIVDYFFGNAKGNLPLGIRILDCLERKENITKCEVNSKIKLIK